MTDKIQTYRQPLVTANGIILGFFLNFSTNWTKQETVMGDGLAYVVLLCLVTGVALLVTSLFRILNMNYPQAPEAAERYYVRTHFFFISGVCIGFLGAFIDMWMNFMSP